MNEEHLHASFHISSKKSLSVAAVAIATKALVPKLSVCLWRCNTWTRPGLFWSACPNRQLCTLGTGRALEPHSHLAAIVCPGGPGRPVFLPPPSLSFYVSAQLSFSSLLLSHSLSRSLPLSPSVFVPQGPVVQLKLSVTQRNQIGFHLQPVTSCVHCASVLPLSAE